ncbi:hypothetical protein [Hymenobacter sp. CRA2]|uniref:hypothetical protein n=1 Tax=Hymenobacter sp. CRA2 TaxID=1955620 RepID=UPI001115F7CE|nr:hypothetical protein [Hymenobacter sp. CRA2]
MLLTLLLAATTAWAVTVTLFQATLEGTSSVKVEWEVLNENGLTGFDLYRKGATDASFNRISAITPTGQRRYQYLDANLYRGPASTSSTNGGPYTYRLIVKAATGEQTYTTVLSQSPSAVQRSWGSIKSMFR